MGLFEKKICVHCGEKAGLLSRVKLDDGFLCGACRKRLSSLSSGWRQRSYADVQAHFAARETDRAKAQSFQATRKLGPQGEIELDEGRRQFIFTQGRDYAERNPEVFDYAQLKDFTILESYDISTLDAGDDDDKGDAAAPAAPKPDFLKKLKLALDTAQTAQLMAELKPFLRLQGSPLDPGGNKRPVQQLEAQINVDHPFISGCRFTIDSFSPGEGQESLNAAYRQALDLTKALSSLTAPAITEPSAPVIPVSAIPTTSPVSPVPPMPAAPPARAAAPEIMAFCPSCGTKNETLGAFCSACGHKLKK